MGILSFSFRLAISPALSFLTPSPSSAKPELTTNQRQSQFLTAASSKPLLQESSHHAKPVGQPPRTFQSATCAQSIICSDIAKPRRLKIVRLLEPDVSAVCAGRMFMSGRMADVCAELDRMEQRSAGRGQQVLVN
jgi:hypothetical protein